MNPALSKSVFLLLEEESAEGTSLESNDISSKIENTNEELIVENLTKIIKGLILKK